MSKEKMTKEQKIRMELADKLVDIADLVESGKKVELLVSALVPDPNDSTKVCEISIADCDPQSFGIFMATMIMNIYGQAKDDTDDIAMSVLTFLNTLRTAGVEFDVVKKIAKWTSELMADNMPLRLSMLAALAAIAEHQAAQHTDLLRLFEIDKTAKDTIVNAIVKVRAQRAAKTSNKPKTVKKAVKKPTTTKPKGGKK